MDYLIPDKVYDILKWVGLIVLPAIAAFVGTVGTAAGWDGTNLCVTVITACGTLVGAVIGVSSVSARRNANEDSTKD